MQQDTPMDHTPPQAGADAVPYWCQTRDGIFLADVPTRPGGRFPDFCIIGAAKCGTTSLNAYLETMPDLFMCPPKEPHYFSTPIMRQRGDAWYRGLYADARPDQLCGEASTSYSSRLVCPDTAERLHAANPRMKLIYLIRDPLRRVESATLQAVKYLRSVVGVDLSDRSLDALLDLFEDPQGPYHAGFLDAGRYIEQIEEYERFFPSDQILILTQRMLMEDRLGTLNQVRGFLGLPPVTALAQMGSHNETAGFVTGMQRERQAGRFRKIPFHDLIRTVLPRGMKDRLLQLAAQQDRRPVLETRFSPARRAEIAAFYAAPTRAMEARIGLPVAEWEPRKAQG